MMNKKASRTRRGKRTRMKIRRLKMNRLCIHRTAKHIYAQIIAPEENQILTSASTVEKQLRSTLDYTGNTTAAIAVGKLVAERAMEKGISIIAFDRSGFKYHGRVKALAEAARTTGLQF